MHLPGGRLGILQGNRQAHPWPVIALLALFVALGVMHFWGRTGDDLAASYLGCRVLADGHGDRLYSYDPTDFSAVADEDTAWDRAAQQGGFDGYVHPYVQTPLWAVALKPLCTRASFRTFDNLFVVLTLLSFAASIYLITWHWTPAFFNLLGVGVILACLVLSQPFAYAMFLVQTHILFFLMTIAALIFARQRPILAGLLLAIAAAVKLTPAILIVYWLLTRRWKAAASMAAWSALLAFVTVVLAHPPLFAAYLANLHRIANVLLVSQNNQSFAAWLMGRFYPTSEIAAVHILPLPHALSFACTALILGFTIAGGLLDRHRERLNPLQAPLGAMLALLAATIFTPIAWTHYSIILLAPLVVLLHENRTLRSWQVTCLALLALVLNYRPFATDVVNLTVGRYAVLRGQFYSGVLCLIALGLLAWKTRRPATQPDTALSTPATLSA